MNLNLSEKERIILGIDPGTRIMGFGVIRMEGNKFSYLDMGVLNLQKIENPLLKLEKIHEEIISLIDRYMPDCMSIETPFYGKNAQSLIKLGRAQGVAIAAALSLQIPVYEYAPLKIKQSLTGSGSSSKEQVCAMVMRVLNMKVENPRYLDATDALAAAICHGLQSRVTIASVIPDVGKKKKSFSPVPGLSTRGSGSAKKKAWSDFLDKHPERIV